MHTSIIVYALFKEISDQYGTSDLIGIYSTEKIAAYQAHLVYKHRTYIKPIVLDLPVKE